MPFGLKLAEYAAALQRSRARLRRLRRETLALQFGGAAGTLAALGDQGLRVAERLAEGLQLPLPEAPWHTHRDRIAEAASVLAIVAGTCGKIARDVQLMMQTDVAEAFEPAGEGRGGSSTMPHKRNPVATATALAAANMAPNLAATIFAAQVQDHERSAGPWHAEWPTLPALLLVTSGALAAIVELAEGMEIDAARMRVNLDATDGLIMAEAVTMALARKIGKNAARHLVEGAVRQAVAGRRNLREVLIGDPAVTAHLDATAIAALFDPMAYQGVSQDLIDRLLASLDGRQENGESGCP
jgi:3-carboxy-cis,cis-muconate cycloisomerase